MFNFVNERYNRQIEMPELGASRQKLLSDAKVVVIGAGGVKSTLLLCLTAMGIGNIRIIEFDKVELSNLNRQILYKTSDIGKSKGVVTRTVLKNLNPEINIDVVLKKINKHNIDSICKNYDFIVEGGESPAGRNLVNKYCLSTNKPFTHASAQFSYGYVFSVLPEIKSACFACFFPNDYTRKLHTGPVPVNVLSTSLAGTLGATEVIKWFIGYKDSMFVNKRLCFSSLLLSSEFSLETQTRKHDCPICSKYYD